MPTFSAVRTTRASHDIILQIRKVILSGEVQPGQRLPTERDMAQQFGVSRVTVRDALRALEAAGLITIRVGGQGGPYVAQPDISQLSDSLGAHLQLRGSTFRDLAEARLALETTATRLATARATPQDLEALKAAIQLRARPSDAHKAATVSLDFHDTLVKASHNVALLTMYLAIRVLVHDALDILHTSQPDMVNTARAAHTQLYEAIAAGDADTAVRIMRAHLEEFADRADQAEANDKLTLVLAEA